MRLHCLVCLFMILFTISMKFEETLSFRRDTTKLLECQQKIHERLVAVPTLPPLSSPSSPFPKMVIGYGADPAGEQDSSDTILEALTDAFQLQTGLHMLPHVADLGGLVIDLQGGQLQDWKTTQVPFLWRRKFLWLVPYCFYKRAFLLKRVAESLNHYPFYGVIQVKDRTFRASPVFPRDRHLVELVPPNSSIFFEDVTFRDVLFDSSFQGGGSILVTGSVRIRITSCYFLHFTTQGIKVHGGHETYISNSFFGQRSTIGGDREERVFSGIEINISSNNNAITDVVIFSAGIGISLKGAANMVTGVHCYNKATWIGGIGILVKSHLTRIDNCYLDYTGIIIEDPVHVHVTNSLFLGDANIVLRSVHGKITGLNIVNNMFRGTPTRLIPIVELKGEFLEIDQVVIDQNNASGMMVKSTTGKTKVSANGTRWVADFSPVLVFPNRINHYQHSFFAQSEQIPANAVTNVSNNVVVVETDRAVTGTVSVFVYQ